MDTKLIKQYGEDILSYRLRTARQKKRMQYEDFDKRLIQLYEQKNLLRERKWNLGWEPLVPPVQKGWKRFFVLRDDVARSKSADFFQGILNKINTYDWSYRKDFMVRRRRYGTKKFGVKEQRLLAPFDWHFNKLSFTDKEKQFFYPVMYTQKGSKNSTIKYVFTEPWRFVLRVRPNMIDKIRIKDAELESQIDLLDNFIERNDLEKRILKIVNGDYQYRWWKWEQVGKHNELYPYKNKSLSQLIDLIKEGWC